MMIQLVYNSPSFSLQFVCFCTYDIFNSFHFAATDKFNIIINFHRNKKKMKLNKTNVKIGFFFCLKIELIN